MALRDTTWIWDTTTASVKDSNAVIDYKDRLLIGQDIGVNLYLSGAKNIKGTKEQITSDIRWIGVTKAAAESVLITKLSDTDLSTNRFDYKVTNQILQSADFLEQRVTIDTSWSVNVGTKDAVSDLTFTDTSGTQFDTTNARKIQFETADAFMIDWVTETCAGVYLDSRDGDTSDANIYLTKPISVNGYDIVDVSDTAVSGITDWVTVAMFRAR